MISSSSSRNASRARQLNSEVEQLTGGVIAAAADEPFTELVGFIIADTEDLPMGVFLPFVTGTSDGSTSADKKNPAPKALAIASAKTLAEFRVNQTGICRVTYEELLEKAGVPPGRRQSRRLGAD